MHAEGKLYIAGINDNPYRILGISSLATRDDAWDALQAVQRASRLKIALLMRSFDVPHILGVVKRFSVFKRYGAKCAVCSVSRSEMLQAAHLRPVSEKGSDDPRNGLVLCANHQLAFNAYLFAFDPESLDIVLKPGVTAEELGITVNSLRELSNKPHPEALAWRYGFWKRNMGLR
ncbi:MAG: HNH endonuclease signature motif containing protein [Bacillota bacterium]